MAGDGSLSQDEIDALLMGADDMSQGGGAPSIGTMDGGDGTGGDGSLGAVEKDMLSDSFNEAIGVAAQQASTMVTKNVSITNAFVEEVPVAPGDVPPGNVIVQMNMGSVPTALIYPEDVAKNIGSVMMGSETELETIDEAQISAIGELSSTILSSLSKNLSNKFNDDLAPGAPNGLISSGSDSLGLTGTKAVKVTYNISVEGGKSGKLVHYIDHAGATKWARSGASGMPDMSGLGAAAGVEADAGGPSGVPYNNVSYPSFSQGMSAQKPDLPPNYELLLDVQMILTVELGRTKKYVKEILNLGEGSIIELDKLAGEPVDLLVNGKLIARGEVVVIDENFGVRVTDIVAPAERLAKMAGSN